MTSEEIIREFRDARHSIETFMRATLAYFDNNPLTIHNGLQAIHSVKSRIKNEDHLIEKIARRGIEVNEKELLDKVTDLAGIRVIHLYHGQFECIHKAIVQKVTDGDWRFVKKTNAISWDPEMIEFFKNIDKDITVDVRDTLYTSVHYIIEPNNDKKPSVKCEIQVRTLLEEVWGEIDHTINYPHPTQIPACKDQIRVLSKLIATGSTLADSIFRTFYAGPHPE